VSSLVELGKWATTDLTCPFSLPPPHRASIDVARGKMVVLSPTTGRLPSRTALIGVSD